MCAQAEYWHERAAAAAARAAGAKRAPLSVEYGNDVEGTLFHPGDELGRSQWNLGVSAFLLLLFPFFSPFSLIRETVWDGVG